MLSMGFNVILMALLALFLVYILVRLVSSPVQWVIKLVVNSIIAMALLCVFSIVGEMWGYHLPINPVTILTIAILGIPGLILVAVLNFLFI